MSAERTPPRYFEDFEAGERFVTGEETLAEAEIVAFARAFDPQPIHVDAEGAAEGPYGGLIASGFQTMALGFRLFYDLGLLGEACIGGPGIDNVRFHRPARPGDRIHAIATVADARPCSLAARMSVAETRGRCSRSRRKSAMVSTTGRSTGTMRAAGTPSRAMTTSSPASAHAIRCDSRAFASPTLTVRDMVFSCGVRGRSQQPIVFAACLVKAWSGVMSVTRDMSGACTR